MLCSRPFRRGIEEYGCGQCMPCRLNRRRLWTARLMLEARSHESSFFVTLTYNQENLPCGGNLSVRHAQLFLKRLRSLVHPRKVRYFIVGEYGDLSMRPHYHAVLFGPLQEKEIRQSWQLGNVHLGSLTEASAAYVVSYTVKGMTQEKDVRLQGKFPEFARMSLRPGIGAGAVEAMKDAIIDSDGVIRVADDVPSSVRIGSRWPIGRYLRRRLRAALWFDSAGEPVLAGVERNRRLQAELRAAGARQAREDQRLQDARKVKVRTGISRSKKGVGL